MRLSTSRRCTSWLRFSSHLTNQCSRPAKSGPPLIFDVRTHVSSHYEFRQISLRRKVAMAVAMFCAVIFIVWILPEWTRTPFQPLALDAILLLVGLSAISSAITIVEIARATLPSTSGWSDERHFWFVARALGVLLVIQ